MTNRKLIGAAKSRAFRALWMLEEIGIPYEHVDANPQSETVKKYNPLGKIPILVESAGDGEDGEFVLYESGAIMTYLGDKYRNFRHRSNSNYSSSNESTSTLVPLAGTNERGLYEQTMSVLLTELDAQGLWIHRKHEAMGEHFTYIPDAVEHSRKYFNKTNRMLIRQLKDYNRNIGNNTGREYRNKSESQSPQSSPSFLLGSKFTAVDIVYVQCLDWSKTIGWDAKWKDDAIVTNYIAACKSRRGYAQTLAMIQKGKDKKRKQTQTQRRSSKL